MKKLITEIRGDDSAELKAKLGDLRKEQFELRFRGSGDDPRKTSRHREVRRTIARIMMVLGERDRAGATKAEAKVETTKKAAVTKAKSGATKKAAAKQDGGKKQ
jgi:large subunit ribosomal protein L29